MISSFIEFGIPDPAELLDDGRRMLLEKQVKRDGIWRIHKSDPDDIFPSDPHADRVDGAEKLDLYTGNVYSKINRQFIRTLSKKVMKFVYNEIMRSKEQNIIDKITQNKTAITYL